MPKNSSPRRPVRNGTTYVYRFFGDDGALLYVGVTNNLSTRFQAHQNKPWWPAATSSTIEAHGNRALALAAEAMAILEERPLHNIQLPRQERVQLLQTRARGVSSPGVSPHDPVAVLNRAYDRIEKLEADLSRVRAELTSVSGERDRLMSAMTARALVDRPAGAQRTVENLRDQLRVCSTELQVALDRAARAESQLENERLKRIVARSRPGQRSV